MNKKWMKKINLKINVINYQQKLTEIIITPCKIYDFSFIYLKRKTFHKSLLTLNFAKILIQL